MKNNNKIRFRKIFLVDNFDSFTFNLVDYFEQLGCEVQVYRNTVDIEMVDKVKPDLIVFSPGPSVPAAAGNMMKIIGKYHKKYPMFGVCLGHEAFLEYFGGSLQFVTPVHGRSSPIKHDGKTIFSDLDDNFAAGRYHSLCADKVPRSFEVSAVADGLVMAMRHKTLPIEGVQFHPESVLSMKRGNGFKMIENVVYGRFANSSRSEQIKQKFSISSKTQYSKSVIEKFLKDSVVGKISVSEQVKFLENFTPEKIGIDEMMIFLNFLIKNSVDNLKMPGAIDICGTGGSGLDRINTSTIASFILAAIGVKVAKHGNKAASGRVGSFDLLEGLGVDIEKNADELEKLYKETGLAFIFARNFHPVMKHFVEARKQIGKPTIFNLLGPLLNPAEPKMQIIGTSFEGQMRLMAEVCKLLGKEKVMVVRAENGLDEVSLTGKTKVVELNGGEILEYEISPEDFGLKKCEFEEISGGDLGENKKIALEILNGNVDSRSRDLVLVNVALALKLIGEVKTLKEGYKVARGVNGVEKLKEYRKNILMDIAESKILGKSDRNFYEALNKRPRSLIAEIKKASPSEGQIFNGNFDPAKIAKIYEKSGASAISVLTDEQYFQGSFENLRKVREAVTLPLLCKDFIVSEYQIYKAREFGADAILLIAAILTKEQIDKFLSVAEGLGMSAIVEIHNELELEKSLLTKAKIIGINNRDLKTFKTDINVTNKLIKMIPENILVVSESGLNSKEDLKKLDKRVKAVLIGTALMKAPNLEKKIRELTK